MIVTLRGSARSWSTGDPRGLVWVSSTNNFIGDGYHAEKDGEEAKSEGKTVEDCPYPKWSIDSFDWLVGYHHGVRK